MNQLTALVRRMTDRVLIFAGPILGYRLPWLLIAMFPEAFKEHNKAFNADAGKAGAG